jgi:Tfp pilus assembly protein PilF
MKITMHNIKQFIFIVLLLPLAIVAQEGNNKELKEAEKALRQSNNITWEANNQLTQNDFVNAEADYRKAISKSEQNTAAPYNLGRAYYNRESYGEAFGRFKQAGIKASEKPVKHKAFHNIGNVYMKKKEYENAVEAYKQSLRNNPNDEETRYNLALAKELLKKQQNEQKNDQNQDDKKNEDNKDQQKNQDQNQDGDNEKEDEGDQKNNENKDQGDEGDKGKEKPEENKEGDGKQKEEKEQQPNDGNEPERKEQPRPNQLSKQQIQNLLEAMQNEEKKVQQRIDEKKVKGAKIKNEKDW